MGGVGFRCRNLWLALLALSCTALFFTAMLVEKPMNKMQEDASPEVVVLPKVALMYLSRGPMPTARVWREWFELAGLVEPTPGAGLEAFLPPTPAATAAAAAAASRRRMQTFFDSGSGGGDGAGRRGGAGGGMTDAPEDLLNDARRSLLNADGGEEVPVPATRDPATTATGAFGGVSAAAASVDDGEGPAAAANCSDQAVAKGGDVISRQELFSVYVHTSVGHSYCPGDMFYGHEVPELERVVVHWGQHTMVDAERALFAAALEEPLNQRFVMLSESCLPLYPPHVVWLQLMWESQSRVNACKGEKDWDKRGEDRWSDHMRTDTLDRDHWRKSSQWASFTRPHAELVAADEQVHEAFRMQCYTYYPGLADVPEWLNETELENRHCISDEHYIPTLLAVQGLDDETDCLGALTHTEWRLNSWSPKQYRPMQVTYYLLRKLRKAWFSGTACAAKPAMDSANSLFRARGASASIQAIRNESSAGRVPPEDVDYTAYMPVEFYDEYQPLDHSCSLFARKFDDKCSEPMLKLAADCDYGLGYSARCATNTLPVVPEAARVAAFQKEMLEYLHALTKAYRSKQEAEAAAAGTTAAAAGAATDAAATDTAAINTDGSTGLAAVLAEAPPGHLSHGGPSSDENDPDANEHLDYWHEHGKRHGIPLPPELQQNAQQEQQTEQQQTEQQPQGEAAINLADFLPDKWPPIE